MAVACTACGAENREGAKFCRQCGTALQRPVGGEGARADKSAACGHSSKIGVQFDAVRGARQVLVGTEHAAATRKISPPVSPPPTPLLPPLSAAEPAFFGSPVSDQGAARAQDTFQAPGLFAPDGSEIDDPIGTRVTGTPGADNGASLQHSVSVSTKTSASARGNARGPVGQVPLEQEAALRAEPGAGWQMPEFAGRVGAAETQRIEAVGTGKRASVFFVVAGALLVTLGGGHWWFAKRGASNPEQVAVAPAAKATAEVSATRQPPQANAAKDQLCEFQRVLI